MKLFKNLLTLLILVFAISLSISCDTSMVESTISNERGSEVKGAFEQGSVLNVIKVEENQQEILKKLSDLNIDYGGDGYAFVYDINVTKDNKQAENFGKATITVPAPDPSAVDYIIYHILDNGTVEIINAKAVDGKVTFDTFSFSYFIFVTKNISSNVNLEYGITDLSSNSYDINMTMKVNGITRILDSESSMAISVPVGSEVTLSVEEENYEHLEFLGFFEFKKGKTYELLQDMPLTTEKTYKFKISSHKNIKAVYADKHNNLKIFTEDKTKLLVNDMPYTGVLKVAIGEHVRLSALSDNINTFYCYEIIEKTGVKFIYEQDYIYEYNANSQFINVVYEKHIIDSIISLDVRVLGDEISTVPNLQINGEQISEYNIGLKLLTGETLKLENKDSNLKFMGYYVSNYYIDESSIYEYIYPLTNDVYNLYIEEIEYKIIALYSNNGKYTLKTNGEVTVDDIKYSENTEFDYENKTITIKAIDESKEFYRIKVKTFDKVTTYTTNELVITINPNIIEISVEYTELPSKILPANGQYEYTITGSDHMRDKFEKIKVIEVRGEQLNYLSLYSDYTILGLGDLLNAYGTYTLTYVHNRYEHLKFDIKVHVKSENNKLTINMNQKYFNDVSILINDRIYDQNRIYREDVVHVKVHINSPHIVFVGAYNESNIVSGSTEFDVLLVQFNEIDLVFETLNINYPINIVTNSGIKGDTKLTVGDAIVDAKINDETKISVKYLDTIKLVAPEIEGHKFVRWYLYNKMLQTTYLETPNKENEILVGDIYYRYAYYIKDDSKFEIDSLGYELTVNDKTVNTKVVEDLEIGKAYKLCSTDPYFKGYLITEENNIYIVNDEVYVYYTNINSKSIKVLYKGVESILTEIEREYSFNLRNEDIIDFTKVELFGLYRDKEIKLVLDEHYRIESNMPDNPVEGLYIIRYVLIDNIDEYIEVHVEIKNPPAYITLNSSSEAFINGVGFSIDGNEYRSYSHVFFEKTKTFKLQAKPNEKFKFIGWYENNKLLSDKVDFEITISKTTEIECRYEKVVSKGNLHLIAHVINGHMSEYSINVNGQMILINTESFTKVNYIKNETNEIGSFNDKLINGIYVLDNYEVGKPYTLNSIPNANNLLTFVDSKDDIYVVILVESKAEILINSGGKDLFVDYNEPFTVDTSTILLVDVNSVIRLSADKAAFKYYEIVEGNNTYRVYERNYDFPIRHNTKSITVVYGLDVNTIEALEVGNYYYVDINNINNAKFMFIHDFKNLKSSNDEIILTGIIRSINSSRKQVTIEKGNSSVVVKLPHELYGNVVGNTFSFRGTLINENGRNMLQAVEMISNDSFLVDFVNAKVVGSGGDTLTLVKDRDYKVESNIDITKQGVYTVNYYLIDNPQISYTVTVECFVQPVYMNVYTDYMLTINGEEVGPDFYYDTTDYTETVTIGVKVEDGKEFMGFYTQNGEFVTKSNPATFTLDKSYDLVGVTDYKITSMTVERGQSNLSHGDITTYVVPSDKFVDPSLVSVYVVRNNEYVMLNTTEYTIYLDGFNIQNPTKGEYEIVYTYVNDPSFTYTHTIVVIESASAVDFFVGYSKIGNITCDKQYIGFNVVNEVNKGDVINLSIDLSNDENYEFKGWYLVEPFVYTISDENLYSLDSNITVSPVKDMGLYAHVERVIKKISLIDYSQQFGIYDGVTYYEITPGYEPYDYKNIKVGINYDTHFEILDESLYTVDTDGLDFTKPNTYVLTYTLKSDPKVKATHTVIVSTKFVDLYVSVRSLTPASLNVIIYKGQISSRVYDKLGVNTSVTIVANDIENAVFKGFYRMNVENKQEELLTTEKTYTFEITDFTDIFLVYE